MRQTEVAARDASLPIVILSTADIDAAVWTNKQHIAVRLAATREVHYVESMGLRAPRFRLSDLRRIWNRLTPRRRRGRGDEAVRHQNVFKLHIHSPKIVPFHAYRLIRQLNNHIVRRKILAALPKDYVLWTFSPLTYGLEARARTIVYHSVDLLHTLEGVPRITLLEAEKRLIRIADSVVVSSQGVASHVQQLGARPLLWENVADIELFRRARSSVRERRAIFVGNLTPSKVNFDLLATIVQRGIPLAIAGPIAIDGTNGKAQFDKLQGSPLVTYLGVLSQEDMALELGKSCVGLIPYHVNDYITGVFPMKVYEYLSAGLHVVSTALPSLVGRALTGVTVCSDDEFSTRVVNVCSRPFSSEEPDLSHKSWESRIAQIEALLADKE